MHTVTRTATQSRSVLPFCALLVAVLAVILACGEGATTTSGGGNSSSGGQTSQSPGQKAAKVGDTITVNGVATTLVSVKKLQPGEFDPTPAAGQGYYALHVKQTNKGSSTADYNELEFKLLTGSGSTINQTFISVEPNDKLLGSGQIAVGGSVEGDLVFQVGTTDHGAKLVWQPGFDNSLDHAWSLGL